MTGMEIASFQSLLLAATRVSDQRLICLIKDNFEALKSERRLFKNTFKKYIEHLH